MLALLSACVVLPATVLHRFRKDQPRLRFSPNSPWATSTDKITHTNEMLTSVLNVDNTVAIAIQIQTDNTLTFMNDLTRLKNAHQ